MSLKPIILLARDRLQKALLNLNQAAMDRGLLPGQKDYVRFIILGRGRVGSNMLTSYLNSNPAIVVKGEIFGARELKKAGETASRDPLEYLRKQAFTTYPRSVRAVGFKLFYYHARRDPKNVGRIWHALVRDRDVKVIHLTRQNILRTYLSTVIARKTSKWTQAGPINAVTTDEKRIALDFEDCRTAFKTTERLQQRAEKMFRRHDVHRVTYEEIASDPQSALNDIQKFIGVEPSRLESFHTKQNTESLRELIENYDELKTRFAETQWAHFFED